MNFLTIVKKKIMSNIIQNMKSGFANMKELFGILLSDDSDNENYDLYINSKDADISNTAQELKKIEAEQESTLFSIFNTRTEKKHSKKKFKSIEISKQNDSSQNNISCDIHLCNNIEPEK